MDNGQWTMNNGQWIMDNGQWTITDINNTKSSCNLLLTALKIEGLKEIRS